MGKEGIMYLRVRKIENEIVFQSKTERLWLSDILEQYHQHKVNSVDLADVVGRSEQFVCVCSEKTGHYIEDNVRLCDNCNAPHYTN